MANEYQEPLPSDYNHVSSLLCAMLRCFKGFKGLLDCSTIAMVNFFSYFWGGDDVDVVRGPATGEVGDNQRLELIPLLYLVGTGRHRAFTAAAHA